MENIKIEDLKPGMRVRIVSKRGEHWNFAGGMDKYKGAVMTIRELDARGGGVYIRMEEDCGWLWRLSDIAEIIYPESIHITRDGNTVHAVLKKATK